MVKSPKGSIMNQNAPSKKKLVKKAILLTMFDFNGCLISIINGLVALLANNLELYAEMMYEEHHSKDIEASKHLQRIGFLNVKF